MPALAEHAYVIAPDMLGHGRSDKPRADYSSARSPPVSATSWTLSGTSGHRRRALARRWSGDAVRLPVPDSLRADWRPRLERRLGREVSIALRAATLPGAELVLPVIAHPYVRDAGLAVSRRLARVPIGDAAVARGGPRVRIPCRQPGARGVRRHPRRRRARVASGSAPRTCSTSPRAAHDDRLGRARHGHPRRPWVPGP